MKYPKSIILLILSFFLTFYTTISCANNASNTYTNSSYLTSIPFGTHSHWIQPWRAYMETISAKNFLDGIGIVWNIKNSANPELIAKMLSKYGFKRVRLEIGWGKLDFNDETQIAQRYSPEFENILLALKKYHLRPLILLNAHHGSPCPLKDEQLTVIENAYAGDTEIKLNNTENLEPGYSGISNLEKKYIAAKYLITDISNDTVTLSKPLPKNLEPGTNLIVTTLKYRPFSIPNTPDYNNTIAGWNQYVKTISQFVTDVLGTTNSNDKGFDLEIWNELTFGSNFLYINKYYDGEPYKYKERDIWQNLVQATANYIEANSENFTGVKISNGFANTIPWTASSEQPVRINAISKHPYPPRKNYPEDEYKGTALNALGEEDSFIPNYSARFPEYYATALQTETIIRDAAPINNEFYGTKRGRLARVINDKIYPVPIWITEINLLPTEDNPNISSEQALALKAKTTGRFFCFYLNKGITQLYLYGIGGGNRGFGIVKDSFLDYALAENSSYPSDDLEYISPALQIVNRIVNQMSDGLDWQLENTSNIQLIYVRDHHNNYQFQGDDTEARPHLYNRDVFTFLPFQVNRNKLVIPYYVMTRDVQQEFTPENFIVKLKGIKSIISVEAYDPINNQNVTVKKISKNGDDLVLNLTATDYPYLLIINGDFS